MSNVPLQVGYWDGVAGQKRFSHPLRLEWLESRLDKRARVLDYGCGYGRTLEDLRSAGFLKTVGVDFSEGMLARCRAEGARQNLLRNDGHVLPFKDEAFDAVLLFAVLTCIPSDLDQRELLSSIKRVLRPHGLLYISDLLLNEDARNRERYQRFAKIYGRYGVFELPEGVVVRHHERAWIEELTTAFDRLEYEPFSVTTMNGNSSAAFQYLGRRRV
jgi:SAM-dependent methyltransferase